MDLLADLGELALASRLRRLSDRLLRDVSRLYGDLDVPFEARWFPLLQALRRQSPQTVTGLARALGLTHPAVTALAREMARRGLVASRQDPRDARRRLVRLAAGGRAVVARLDPVWEEIRQANRELLAEDSVDLLAALGRLEARLDRRSMYERVAARLETGRAAAGPETAASASAGAGAGAGGKRAAAAAAKPARLTAPPAQRVAIVPYRPAYKKHFRALNEAWLREHFSVEPEDTALLADPNGRIVRRGGAVLFALRDGEVVGTCALLRHRADLWELAKMAVAAPVRGQGLGRRLAEAAIVEARRRGARTLFLETSPVLKPALALYRSLGFRRVRQGPLGPTKYRRCTIAMVLALDPGRGGGSRSGGSRGGGRGRG